MTAGWLVLEVRGPSVEERALLTEGLIALGADAVVESGEWLSTWLPATEVESTLTAAQEQLSALLGRGIDFRWSLRDEQDWSKRWREGLGARRVSARVIVTPSWITPERSANDIVLTIDPQMAFGTGEHASTRGALRLIEATLEPGARMLDVGTGSAILAILAALLGASHVDAVESDADALINASENVERHQCSDRVKLHHAFVDLDYLNGTACTARYDMIAGNVLSGVLVPLLPGFRAALHAGGWLILAGIMKHEADHVIEAATATGFRLEREDRDEDWWGGAFKSARP